MDSRDALQFIRESLQPAPSGAIELKPLVKGGSDRVFYRAFCGEGATYIFMWYDPARTENNYYAEIGRFLREIGVNVPTVLRFDSGRHYILMEDLGERDLWSFRDASWRDRKKLYRDVLSEILKLHAVAVGALNARNITLMPGFDAALYAWEHDYFREQFVTNVCGIEWPVADQALTGELDALIRRMEDRGGFLVHRDFQSQNVMIQNGKPGLIDFQGMRVGSLFYDLGSLLYDPYVTFTEDQRAELLRFYYDRAETGIPFRTFDQAFREAAAQRLMQALGAYGYLGKEKGKASFLGHIPSALENLIDASWRTGTLNELNRLARQCREALGAQKGRGH